MKKLLSLVFTSVLLLSCFGVQALGDSNELAEPSSPGIYGVKNESGSTLIVFDANDNPAEPDSATYKIKVEDTIVTVNDFYPNAENLQLSYDMSAGHNYLILILDHAFVSGESINNEDIYYIWQDSNKPKSDGTYTFILRPKTLRGGDYFVYVSDDTASDADKQPQLAGTFSYFSGGLIPNPIVSHGAYIPTPITGGTEFKNKKNVVILSAFDPDGGWKDGVNEFSVSSPGACVAYVKSDDTYRQAAYEKRGEKHVFTVEIHTGEELFVVRKGDLESEGEITVKTISSVISAFLAPWEMSPSYLYKADVSAFEIRDISIYISAFLNEGIIEW